VRPAPCGWDDLSLGACAELLADEAEHTPAAAAALVAAAAAEPPLAAVLAIRRSDDAAMRAAAARCGERGERGRLLRVALLQDGFRLAQRARALRALASVWLPSGLPGAWLAGGRADDADDARVQPRRAGVF
jgi:hypothetical protein